MDCSLWKKILIRTILWLLVKFIKNPNEVSLALLGNPIIGVHVHGPLLLALAKTNEVNPFDLLKDNLSSLEETYDDDATEPAPVARFKVYEGGKMEKKFRHHAETPLITIILVSHSEDCHLLHRSISSILNQNMPLGLLELLVYFDGIPNKEEAAIINSAADSPLIDLLYNCQLHYPTEKNGYYCVGRNRMTPLAQGFYIYNMDADNEIDSTHLSNLLEEIRIPDDQGFPHFTYTRRKYITDEGVENAPTKQGMISAFVPWEPNNLASLAEGPANNFIDTGDFLISKSALYRISDVTGCIWNAQCRRFGDWDLVARMVGCGFRGRALDQATNHYHWTGKNLQMTRNMSDIVVLPESIYNEMKAKGQVVD